MSGPYRVIPSIRVDSPLKTHRNSDEIADLFSRLELANDREFYRVYYERHVNPDRIKPKPEVYRVRAPINFSAYHDFYTASPLVLGFSKDDYANIQEYERDQQSLDKHRVLQFLESPNTEYLDIDTAEAALIPQYEDNENEYEDELYKYMMKMNLRKDDLVIHDRVAMWFREQAQLDRMFYQEAEKKHTFHFYDPIAAYEGLYDPVSQLIRSIPNKWATLRNHTSLREMLPEHAYKLYETEDPFNYGSQEYGEYLEQPNTTHFLDYANAKRDIAFRKLRDDPGNPRRHEWNEEVIMWEDLTRPFEYKPKEEPKNRPEMIEVPDVKIIDGSLAPLFYNNARISGGSDIEYDYVTMLKNKPGKIIESTYRFGQPVKLKYGVDKLNDCLQLTLPHLHKGQRALITCPGRMVFGPRGRPESGYPPGEDIVYDIILHEITRGARHRQSGPDYSGAELDKELDATLADITYTTFLPTR